VKIGYSNVHLGRDVAREQIFSRDESFGYLFNFKVEIDLRVLESVIEIDVINQETSVYFHRFFCCLKLSIDGFLNGCRPFLSIDSIALNGRWNGHLPLATAQMDTTGCIQLHLDFFDGEILKIGLGLCSSCRRQLGIRLT
jgi:hypothetical protein